jgi:hypothetical protein
MPNPSTSPNHSLRRIRVVFVSVTLLIFALVSVGVAKEPAANATSNNFTVVAGTGGSPFPPGPNGTASLSAGFASPGGEATDEDGNLLIADTNNNEVDLVVEGSTSAYDISGVTAGIVGDVYVIAGGGGTTPTVTGTVATSALLDAPSAVALDPEDDVIIADTHDDEVEVLAEDTSNPGYVISGPWIRGDVYVIAGGGAISPTVTGSIATMDSLQDPSGVAVMQDGDVVIADTGDNEVERLANSDGFGVLGDLYVIVGGGSASAPTVDGLSATTAELNGPTGVAIDAGGDIAIADTNHDAVDIYAVATTDPGFGIGSNWVVHNVYRVIGGGATAPTSTGEATGETSLNGPQGIAFDADGDLLVADVFHHEVDVDAIATTNPGFAIGTGAMWTQDYVYVIAGGGTVTAGGSGSVANETRLFAPIGVAMSSVNELAIIDQGSYLLDALELTPTAAETATSTTATSTTATSTTASTTATTVAPDAAPDPDSGTGSSSTSSTLASSPSPTAVLATSTDPTSSSLHPIISQIGGNRRVVSHALPFVLRCSVTTCKGVVSVIERHKVTKKVGHGSSITVIEDSVVAKISYDVAAKSTAHIKVPLTSYGRRVTSSRRFGHIAVIAAATVFGGASVTLHFKVLA